MCSPGQSDMGTCWTISWEVLVEAMKVTNTGNAITKTPSRRIACARKVPKGRRSIMSILHPFLDVAELHHGQRDHDRHQDHRLRRGAPEVQRLHAVVVHLVDQDRGVLAGPALRGGIDDREGVEEGVD